MAELTDLTNEVTQFARDAAYVAVGMGVLGYQRAMAQRNDLMAKLGAERDLDGRLADLRSAVTTGIQQVDSLLETATTVVESTVAPLEEQLPEPARELAHLAHERVRLLRSQLRVFVPPTGQRPANRPEDD